MFEKEARKWVKEHTKIDYQASYGEFPIEPSAKKSFKAGAEFGYNKANEWHFMKDGLPKTDGYYLVFNKGTRSVIIGMFVDGQFESCFPVAWKEIVLPEIKESEQNDPRRIM